MKRLLISIFSVFLVGCGTLNTLNIQQVMTSNINGLHHVEATVFASGQPTKTHLIALKDAGIMNIINLRPESEIDWNEAMHVRQLGMKYHSIPISGVYDMTNENAVLLQNKLTELDGQSVLVHCSSGNRLGALIAIDQYMSKQKSVEFAIKQGKLWGLASKEDVVRGVLNEMERVNE